MNIARDILEKHLNKDVDIKTYLKGSTLTYEVVLDAINEALTLTSVSQQRELLISFLEYLRIRGIANTNEENVESRVNLFIKRNL